MMVSSGLLAEERRNNDRWLDEALCRARDMSSVAVLYPYIARYGKQSAVPLISPLHGHYRISSRYGMRRHPIYGKKRMHWGLDMACQRGTAVYATADGIVASSGYNGGYGNMVGIIHRYGFQTCYAHLSYIAARKGQTVRRGDIIGLAGSTGLATGSHLHYEIRKNGRRIRPVIID